MDWLRNLVLIITKVVMGNELTSYQVRMQLLQLCMSNEYFIHVICLLLLSIEKVWWALYVYFFRK